MPNSTVETPELETALPELAQRSEDLLQRLFSEIQRRPVRSLLIAAGTGYLTGGGLGTRFTARLLGVGARMALQVAIVPVLVDAVERALERNGQSVPFSPNRNSVHKEMHS
jgi:hypothetical protein